MTRICVVLSFGSINTKQRTEISDRRRTVGKDKSQDLRNALGPKQTKNTSSSSETSMYVECPRSVLEVSYLDPCTGLRVLLF